MGTSVEKDSGDPLSGQLGIKGTQFPALIGERRPRTSLRSGSSESGSAGSILPHPDTPPAPGRDSLVPGRSLVIREQESRHPDVPVASRRPLWIVRSRGRRAPQLPDGASRAGGSRDAGDVAGEEIRETRRRQVIADLSQTLPGP